MQRIDLISLKCKAALQVGETGVNVTLLPTLLQNTLAKTTAATPTLATQLIL